MAEPQVIETPYGPMYVSGHLRVFGSVLCDLFSAFLAAFLLNQILLSLWPEIPAAKPVLLIITFAYPLLGRLGLAPSLGQWALGLHVYAFSEIEGWAGRGRLWVYEPLPRSLYVKKVLIAAAGIATLYVLNLAMSSLAH